MNRLRKAVLCWNTARTLKLVQLKHQIINRIYNRKKKQKKLLQYVSELHIPDAASKIKILIPELDCEESYLGRFCTDGLLDDDVTLLHETHKIEKIWEVPSASHLWNYNLHYLEFLIPLAVRFMDTAQEKYFLKWKQLAERWMEQSCGDSFEPYTISMRIPNLLVSMELLEDKIRNTQIEKKLLSSVYRQYRYLICSQELALLANHYFENLKTIIISSLLFGELDTYHKYFDLFLKQTDEQILPDGMHFERSFMYHKIILEDFLRVYSALHTSGHPCDAEKLIPVIRAMALALADLEQGFGQRTPLFNDAGNNVSKNREQLLKAVQRICGYEKTGARNFNDCGYYKLSADGIAVLFDCGDIGPSYMGGHGHCDCLSFELAVGGRCMFVNSGTGCYQGGDRAFFRGTKAHNTIMIDDREQAELWGEHRAARRMTGIRGAAKKDRLIGRFRSYLGDFFQRTIRWDLKRRVLVITDEVRVNEDRVNGARIKEVRAEEDRVNEARVHGNRAAGKELHIVRQFFHLAPQYRYVPLENQVSIMDGECRKAVIRFAADSEYRIHRNGVITNYAQDFGRYEKKQVLEIRTRFTGSIRLRTEIEVELETGE